MDRHSRFVGELYYGEFNEKIKMNKNEIYVPINNRKEAKQAKAVLKALGEPTSSSFYNKEYDENCHLYFNKIHSEWVISLSGTFEHKKITLKQLIELLVSESNDSDKGNDTLAKIAVKVENEKEFKALMKYYDSLGFRPYSSGVINRFVKGDAVDFHDLYRSTSVSIQKNHGYKIIPFVEFATEHNIKLPLLTSEDGVDLYEGDIYHRAYYYEHSDKSIHNGWRYDECSSLYPKHSIITHPETSKAFSTKQAALYWIEAKKPKSLSHRFNPSCNVVVDAKGVDINDDGLGIRLTNGQLHKINSMVEELNNG